MRPSDRMMEELDKNVTSCDGDGDADADADGELRCKMQDGVGGDKMVG
jgi:hypothetical protein